VNPDGTRAYVTNWYDDTVSVIDTSSNTVLTIIPVGDGPSGVAVAPDGDSILSDGFESGDTSAW